MEERGLSVNLTAWITALAIAVNVPGNWFGSWLIHKGISRWLLILCGTLVMGSASILIFSEQLSDGLRFVLVLIFSFCGGVQPAALISGATFHSPTKLHLGATNGFMYQGSQSGSVFGPPIIAAIVTQTGKWESAGWLLFSLTCISLIAVFLMRKYEKRIEDKC
jgi:MFS family permease